MFWKYKHNKNSGKLIVAKEDDRHFGLTTMMINDCLSSGCKLYVPNERAKRYIVNTINEMLYSPYFTTTINPYNYVVTHNDLSPKSFKENSSVNVIVDNQCTPFDVETLLKFGCNIVNGFVYCRFVS